MLFQWLLKGSPTIVGTPIISRAIEYQVHYLRISDTTVSDETTCFFVGNVNSQVLIIKSIYKVERISGGTEKLAWKIHDHFCHLLFGRYEGLEADVGSCIQASGSEVRADVAVDKIRVTIKWVIMDSHRISSVLSGSLVRE